MNRRITAYASRDKGNLRCHCAVRERNHLDGERSLAVAPSHYRERAQSRSRASHGAHTIYPAPNELHLIPS